jgi:hypothetical protein
VYGKGIAKFLPLGHLPAIIVGCQYILMKGPRILSFLIFSRVQDQNDFREKEGSANSSYPVFLFKRLVGVQLHNFF